jgi:hypothetical protein
MDFLDGCIIGPIEGLFREELEIPLETTLRFGTEGEP